MDLLARFEAVEVPEDGAGDTGVHVSGDDGGTTLTGDGPLRVPAGHERVRRIVQHLLVVADQVLQRGVHLDGGDAHPDWLHAVRGDLPCASPLGVGPGAL